MSRRTVDYVDSWDQEENASGGDRGWGDDKRESGNGRQPSGQQDTWKAELSGGQEGWGRDAGSDRRGTGRMSNNNVDRDDGVRRRDNDGQDSWGREGSGRDNMGRGDGSARDNWGREGPSRDNMGRGDGSARDNWGREGSSRDGAGRDNQRQNDRRQDGGGRDTLRQDSWERDAPSQDSRGRDTPPQNSRGRYAQSQDSGRGDTQNQDSRRQDDWEQRGNQRRDGGLSKEPSSNGSGDVQSPDSQSSHSQQLGASGSVAGKEEEQVVEGLLETLQNVDIKLADKQADVSSPLYSVKTFEELGLDEKLLKGIYAMKFVKPSKVQERALPLLLSDPPQNMIAQSQSGTGKTAAFALAMLKRVDTSIDQPQALCVAPTRELARQIVDVVRKMGQFTAVQVAICLREEAPRTQNVSAHILVGTPGTLLEMERRRLIDLRGVRIFVLDEADVMLDKQGMGLQSMRLRKLCPESAQLLLFSATFSEAVIDFAHMIIPNANEITLRREEVSITSIKQYYIECDSYPHKIEMLSLMYGLLTIGQSIIFVATRASAEEIQQRMADEGHLVSLIHGGMTPEERDKVLDQFRQGQTKVLIATNVLARGIDVLQVSLVINFDLPMTPERNPDPETYIHRIGRTGRFGRTGVAINFVHNRLAFETMHALEDFFGREIIRMPTESLELLEQKLHSINHGLSSISPPSTTSGQD